MPEPLLKCENVSEVFGGLKAVSDFNLYINPGELVGLIGPNGAGKTTAFNLFTGVYQPTTGTITFAGESLLGLKPYQITQKGIARTFQNIRLFAELSVLDNVKIAFHSHVKYGLLESVLRLGRYFGEEERIEEESKKLLKIFHLEEHAEEQESNLQAVLEHRKDSFRIDGMRICVCHGHDSSILSAFLRNVNSAWTNLFFSAFIHSDFPKNVHSNILYHVYRYKIITLLKKHIESIHAYNLQCM